MSRNPFLILLTVLASLLFTSNVHAVYHVQTGRFLQADPNASGQPLLYNARWFHGAAPSVAVIGFDMEERYRDGVNLYQYLASNPVNNSDPLGLFIMPGPGDFITGMLESLVSEYAARQDFDVDWAMNSEMGDDWHSRLDSSWVTHALGQGLYNAFDIGFGEYSVNPLDMFASASGGRRGVSPGAPNPRLRMLGARMMGPLDRLSPFDIARAFKDSGLKVSQTFMNRLRGVGRNSDPARMASLGIRNLEDIQQVLRYGSRSTTSDGKMRLVYRGVEVVLDADGRTLYHIGYASP
ncbi:MAG: hypothetical protein KF859_07340 [Phycisphaeraceae bacterium]|nr:hypothetical protein [Phycisphaeraceae bacterium]